MKKVIKSFVVMCAVMFLFSGEVFANNPKTIYTSIGGDLIDSGVICRIVNKGRKEHGFRCSSETEGSTVNSFLPALEKGKADFVFITEEEFKNSAIKDKIYALFRLPDNRVMVTLDKIDQNKVEIMVQKIIKEKDGYFRMRNQIVADFTKGKNNKNQSVTNSYDINFMKNTGIIPLHPIAKSIFQKS